MDRLASQEQPESMKVSALILNQAYGYEVSADSLVKQRVLSYRCVLFGELLQKLHETFVQI
jgi:hypothetical protein